MPKAGSKVALDARLARTLKAAREAAGLSLREVARRAGWSVGRVQQYESAQTSPTVRALRDLAGVYGASIGDWLRDGPTQGKVAPPGRMPWNTGVEGQWLVMDDGSKVLVAFGVRDVPGVHVVLIEGRRAVGWVERERGSYRFIERADGGYVGIKAADIIGRSYGIWRDHG